MQPSYQFSDYLPDLPIVPSTFQPQQLRYQPFAFVQHFSRYTALIQQKMSVLGAVVLQTFRHGSEQGRYFLRGFPRLASIVYNDRKHRRQAFTLIHPTCLDQVKQ